MGVMLFVVPFCGVFILMGLWLTHIGLITVRTAMASSRWIATTGQIIRSEIVSEPSPNSEMLFAALSYFYHVGGQEYVGNTIFIGNGISSSNRGLARKYTERYPEGRQVLVYYDVEEPSSAVLEPGVLKYHFIEVVAGLVFAFGGMLIMLSFWRLLQE